MSLHPRSYPRKETSPTVLSPLELPITQDQGSYALLGKWQMVKGQSEYMPPLLVTHLDQPKQRLEDPSKFVEGFHALILVYD